MQINLLTKRKNFITLYVILLIFCFPIIIFSKNETNGSTISGKLTEDTVLDSASGPWTVVGSVTVPAHITLTIEPGVTVYFKPGKRIFVQTYGCLIAVGNEKNKILMTCENGTNNHWRGISFTATMEDNQLCYVNMFYADFEKQSILVENSKLLIDHMEWNNNDIKIIVVDHPSLIVQNSTFPDNIHAECIRGAQLSDNEYLIIQNNVFGRVTGKEDAIDFSDAHRPGPILQVYNNIFWGGQDEALDLDGCDAHIEGNFFTGFYPYADWYTSNAISTGKYSGSSDITVVRNIFYDNDHAILLKQGAFLIAENNTFVKSAEAAINFSEMPVEDVGPGKGAILEGNIFWNNNAPFKNLHAHSHYKDPQVEVYYSIISSDFHELGENNLDVDPEFYDEENDFHLLPTSPAMGAGPNGIDMGAYVNAGVSISGEPDSITYQTAACLTIDGPGITHYSFTVNDPEGEWSEEISLDDDPTIELSDLTDGESYTVYVKGKNSAGVWQSDPEYAASQTWTVDLDTTSDTTGVISGFIYEIDGQTPISGAEIFISFAADSLSDSLITTTSNDTGYYSFSVESGNYFVQATGKVPAGFIYESQYYRDSSETGEKTMIQVEPGHIVTNINFQLIRKGIIMGKVFLGDTLTPADSATIVIFHEDWSQVQLTPTIISDTSGNYFVRLPSESYYFHSYIYIGDDLYEDYYFKVSRPEDATLVILASPDTLRDVDFVLKRQNQNNINGQNQINRGESFLLLQNYPNPFNGQTKIIYQVPENLENSIIRISIYDNLGRLVTILKQSKDSAGKHSIYWNGINELGHQVPSGIYFYNFLNS
ncbi:MAG: T9SS type A sorting domain-containing protein [bacterium]